MSYAQWHYPFENQDKFEQHFPADFICEAIDQTRGWFYTLHAIATLVSDSVAYKNCICLSHIVDKDGKKMSKSLGNIVDPYDVFDTVGADALRWYFLARLSPEVQKRISVDIVADVASSFINTFWNTYGFFVLYARLDDVDLDARPGRGRPEIDRWALALAAHTITDRHRGDGRLRRARRRVRLSSRSSTSSATGTCAAIAAASGNRPILEDKHMSPT